MLWLAVSEQIDLRNHQVVLQEGELGIGLLGSHAASLNSMLLSVISR
jgi:hypothetical protein